MQLTFSLVAPKLKIPRLFASLLLTIALVLSVSTIISDLPFAFAATPPLDKSTLYALSGHVFVGTITDIETKMYIDSANDEWKEKHLLLTIKVKTVLKTAKHTNSLSGDFDFKTKMSYSFDEQVSEGSFVQVLTSSTVSLPKGWSGDFGLHENLSINDVHTFYCTFVGKRRFQYDKTFPYVGIGSTAATAAAADAAEGIESQEQVQNTEENIDEQQRLSSSHTTYNTYLPLSPNGIGPVVGHEDIIADAVITAAETYHVIEKNEEKEKEEIFGTYSFDDTSDNNKLSSNLDISESEERSDISAGAPYKVNKEGSLITTNKKEENDVEL